jgi:hypothetical protein
MEDRRTQMKGRFTTPSPLVYLAAAVAVYWRVWSGNPAHDVQFGPDVALITWFLAWVPQALLHGHNPLFSTAANAPYGINMLNNTSELLLGALGTPITLLFGPIATFNVLMTTALAGSATSAYFLTRRFTDWLPAAFAAGLVFGFSPYMMASSFGTHIQLSFMVVPPLILLVLHEMLIRQQWSVRRCGLSLAGLVIAQFFISVEVLVSTALMAALVVVVVVIAGRHSIRERADYVWRSAVLAAAVVVVVLAYPIWFLARGPGSIRGPIQLVPEAYRADLLAPFIPDVFQKLAPSDAQTYSVHFSNSLVENGSYLGIPLVMALGVGVLWLRRRADIWVLAICGIGMFVLSLGGALAIVHAPVINPYGSAVGRIALPEAILNKLPLLKNTIPGRFSGYVALFAALLLALILHELHQRWAGRRAGWAAPALVAVVCFIPLIPAVPIESIGPLTIPTYFSGNAVTALQPGSTTLVLPYPSEPFYEAQTWQVDGSHPFRFNLPGGYFLVDQSNNGYRIAFSTTISYTRDSLTAETFIGLSRDQVPAETPSLKAKLLKQLHQWGVTNVVVPLASTPYASVNVAFVTWLFGPPTAANVSGATVWYRI